MSSAYLLPNLVEFEESELAPRPRMDPLFVELVIVQGHDAFHTRPLWGTWSNAQTSVLIRRDKVLVRETDPFSLREWIGGKVSGHRRQGVGRYDGSAHARANAKGHIVTDRVLALKLAKAQALESSRKIVDEYLT